MAHVGLHEKSRAGPWARERRAALAALAAAGAADAEAYFRKDHTSHEIEAIYHTQRVQVLLHIVFWPESASYRSTFGPQCLTYGYLDPLGYTSNEYS